MLSMLLCLLCVLSTAVAKEHVPVLKKVAAWTQVFPLRLGGSEAPKCKFTQQQTGE